MNQEFTFELPLPPSDNQLYLSIPNTIKSFRGITRRVKSKPYKIWLDLVDGLLLKYRRPEAGVFKFWDIYVEMNLYEGSHFKRDLPNCSKSVHDLFARWLDIDDRYVMESHFKKVLKSGRGENYLICHIVAY